MRSWDDYKKTMRTPETLWTAAKANDLAALARLIPTNDLNQRDHRGYSPLMLAVYAGHLEAARALIGAGADPNSADFGGNTVLMGAAFKGHLELVHELVRAGADPAATNATGLTARDFATTFGRREVATALETRTRSPRISRLRGFLKLLAGRLPSSFQ